MPETKQLTAMMMLRERLQKVIDIEPSGTIEVIIKQIDTELLAVEKQQHIDTFNAGAKENGEWKDTYQNADIYYETTFNTK